MPNPGSQKKGSANLFYQGAQGESIAPCPGDVDLNGTVDDDDIGVITAFYETTGAGWAQGDFSGDGYVGSEDYGVAASYYELVPARSVSRTWDWSLDGVGNWAGYREDAGAGGQGNWDLEQSRLHNKVNEIDDNDDHADAPDGSISGGNWVLPKYDAAGNMTSGPKPGSETVRLHFVFDAWNRLVAVWQDDGDGVLEKEGSPPQDTLIATYRYDATGRRIRKLLGTNPAAPTLALDYYHNNAGQIIEVHKDEDDDHPLQQYVWSPRYVHAPILRWRDGNGDGDFLDANETLYYCADANFNVTALVDTAGAVVERYLYDPYGKATFLKADWSLQEVEGHADGTASAFANELLFTGHRLDPESGLYITLHRHYHPTLGRWMQRDPKGYVDGMSLYEYCRSGPIARFDALGTDADELKGVTRKHVKTGQTVTDVYYIDKPEFFGNAAAPRFVGTMDPNGKVTLPNGRITTIGQVYAEAKAWGTDFDAFQESNRTWDPDPDNNRGGTVGGLIGRQQRMEKAQEDAAWDTERKAVDAFDAKAYDKIFELGDAVRSAAYTVAAQWAAAPLGTLGTMQKFVPPAPSPTGTASSAIKGAPSAASPVGRSGSPLSNAPQQPVRNAPGVVNGRQYSGHAFDQMQNRGLTPSVVENTIQNGKALPGNRPGSTIFHDPVNNVSAVTDTATGRVVTVRQGAP